MQTFEYSAKGFALTKSFEGCRLTSYQDVAGIWTIGYGYAGPEVHVGLVWTQDQADAMLLQQLQLDVLCVSHAVRATITQGQFDALVDFSYNAGRGALLGSTLLKKVNAGDVAGAAAQFGLWVHAGGEAVPGLVRRRKAEAEMFVQ